MSSKLLWQLIGALLVLGILAGGWFLIIQPVFAAVAADETALTEVEAQHELITADIRAMTDLDVGALEREVAERTTQLPHVFDEAAIYRELERIVEGTGATLERIAVTPPTPFVGVPSAAELPEGLAPAITPEALAAAGEAGLVVATATIEFSADTHAETLAVISGLSDATRIYLVASGSLSDSATQRVVAELYFLPRDVTDVAIVEGR